MTAEAALDRLVDAITTGDADAVRALYHPDARIWHNFDQVEQTVDENLLTLAWMIEQLPERRYEQIVRWPIDGGTVQQHVLRGTTAGGVDVDMPACLFAWVDGDRITRIEEYVDTAQAAALRGT
ncbi:MAG: nuclear transport factor 2 family protein [Acidimicrobiales bacterium]